MAGSPAIDKGDNTLVPIDPSTGLPVTTDQRGFTRVVNGTVDIGAFEDQVVVTTPTKPQTAIVGSAATVNLGSFADSAINPGNSTVVVDFGDGSPTMTLLNVAPGSLGSVTHTFTSPGTNTVTVTVTDQFGDANLGTLAVVVETPTSISVSASSSPPLSDRPRHLPQRSPPRAASRFRPPATAWSPSTTARRRWAARRSRAARRQPP